MRHSPRQRWARERRTCAVTGTGPVLLDESIEMINASLDGYVEGPDQGLESRVARQRRTTLLVT